MEQTLEQPAQKPELETTLPVILGSQSYCRKEVFEQHGMKFTVTTADIDEKAIRFDDPTELTLTLAKAKAAAILSKITEPVLLVTSDQVVTYQNVIREKPETDDEAREFLRSYAQNPAETVTSVAVTNTATGKQVTGTDIATIYFKPIPEEVIEEYIATKDPFSQAGAFNHNHPLLAPYVGKIDGEGESISGLPWTLTKQLLIEAEKE